MIRVNELPSPPSGKTGWPWREEIPSLPASMPDGSSWPKISIVTASYNQGQYIEETIRSVLLQGYPNLEYIVMDGGSKDDSVEIIEKYEPWLAYWDSEPDRGQSHAINKGFSRASGEIFGWLNSDDFYTQNSLTNAAIIFAESRCDVLSGNTVYLKSGQKGEVKTPAMFSVGEMLRKNLSAAPQPSTFWTCEAWQRYGPLDETLHYRMDYALFLCFAASDLKWISHDESLALFRRHEEQKTWAWSEPNFHLEKQRAITRFAQYDDFGQRYAKEISRGLFYEGWLVSWMAINNVHNNGIQGFLKMLTAPLDNWRCLTLPAYYRKTFGTISGTLKKMWR